MEKYQIVTENDIKIGMTGEFCKEVIKENIEQFAKITGDENPMHMDNNFAKTTQFGKRIAHGMFSASLISAVIGMKIPGPGAIYLGQSLNFKAPVYFGDVLVAKATVVKISQKANFKIVTLDTVVTNQDGVIVTDGQAKVIPVKK
ncbi:crotonase [Paucilactobacillus oligofermentans DSM 15707 = LMG 22743]|uniref:Crotonase n=1 Tax=Paucilactobacillus oligofermentans DSM 15707 = LMG 22743 TaxID=1423778 RepID=A0A0R1RKQ1_9LACO|nr:MaoC family dehydratase [Paucilactobacillus oligofermentans]KRL57744.1 crotonase [Paucilactobacillus oligofermentans DSM 15707 = LMG 22743]CUS26806.1 Putative 3-hydroxybutyryl-CoA dehydratase [Paucilactobacillus oligofermentans DSM 15707 = LMG 22743]